jgi:hypothetical protein
MPSRVIHEVIHRAHVAAKRLDAWADRALDDIRLRHRRRQSNTERLAGGRGNRHYRIPVGAESIYGAEPGSKGIGLELTVEGQRIVEPPRTPEFS